MRIKFLPFRAALLPSALSALLVAGCHLLPGAEEDGSNRFPRLNEVPNPPTDVTPAKEQDAIIRSLERERDGLPAPGGTPAVPPRPAPSSSSLEEALEAIRAGRGAISPKTDFAVAPGRKGPLWAALERMAPAGPPGAIPEGRIAAAQVPGAPVTDGEPAFRGTLRIAAVPRDAEGVTGALAAGASASVHIPFLGESDRLAPGSAGQIRMIAERMKDESAGRAFVYATGPASKGLATSDERFGAFSLSLRRASAVTSALVAEGAPPERIEVVTGHDATRFTALGERDRAALRSGALVVIEAGE